MQITRQRHQRTHRDQTAVPLLTSATNETRDHRRGQLSNGKPVGGDLAGAIERVTQIGARVLLQSALEAEVTVFVAASAPAIDGSQQPGRANSRGPAGVEQAE